MQPYTGADVTSFIDFLSLTMIILLTAPILYCSGMLRDFFHAFTIAIRTKVEYTEEELKKAKAAITLAIKTSLASGFIVMIMTWIALLRHLSSPESLGPSLSVSLISMLYALMIVFFLIPVQATLEKLLIEKIQKEKDRNIE